MIALDIAAIQAARPQNQLQYFATIGSTMTEASRLANEHAPHNTVVVAEEQTSGIGRLGRSWISEKNVGIYTSVLLRLPLIPAKLPLASLLVGLAVAEAIEEVTQLACDLRWPNDILVGGKKVAGILPQLVETCVVAGVGINVNNTAFPDTLRTPAASLLLASGGLVQSREQILIQVLQSIDTFSALLIDEGSEAILRAFTAASTYVTNRRIMVEESGLRGVTAGLDENGFLLLRGDNGLTQRISSGGVRPDGGWSS